MNHWDLDPNLLGGAWRLLLDWLRERRLARKSRRVACVLQMLG